MTRRARSVEELDGAVRRLEDRFEIAEVVARFAMAADDRDFAAVRELVAEDAVWELGDDELVSGADAVVDHLRSRMAGMAMTIHTPEHHVLAFDSDDDHASGIVAAHAEIVVSGEPLVAAVRYRDRYVRQEGRWRIHRRGTAFVYVAPLRDLAGGLATPLRVRWPGREPEPADLPGAPSTEHGQGQGGT